MAKPVVERGGSAKESEEVTGEGNSATLDCEAGKCVSNQTVGRAVALGA